MAANLVSYPLGRYKLETNRAISDFIFEEITFPECLTRLEDALTKLLREVSVEDLSSVRDLMIANNEILLTEMAKRERQRTTIHLSIF